jgi:hypothetical protein
LYSNNESAERIIYEGFDLIISKAGAEDDEGVLHVQQVLKTSQFQISDSKRPTV